MKTTLVLVFLSSFYLITAVPLKRTRQPTTTTDAGFMAKIFRIPDFLKFSRNDGTTEPPVKTIEIPQKSGFLRVLDSVNIFKKEKPFGEPYLRAYVQPDGSYKWYFVYPGQMLYPAPDDFSVDLERTIPPTTPTTTTTTTVRPTDSDDEYKPLYPLGKIEFVKNETEPKENKGAITISDDGPIFQPYAKIKPPFDEPLLQQFQVNGTANQEPQETVEPAEENESITQKHKSPKKDEEQQAQDNEPAEDDQPVDETKEQTQDENQSAYDNEEEQENSPDDENVADDNERQDEDEKTVAETPPADERTLAKKAKSQKVKTSG